MTEKITLNENNLSYSVNDKGDRMITLIVDAVCEKV